MTATRRKSANTWLLRAIGTAVGAALLVACVDEGGSTHAITKDEARRMGGRSASGEDLCLREGWYADHECDDFCVAPDPDCVDAGHDSGTTTMIDAGAMDGGGGMDGGIDAGAPDGCRAESDLAFCIRMDQWCGPVSGMDDCGRARYVANCGPEPNTTSCPGACTPESDSELCLFSGKNCGTLSTGDRCGNPRTVECGVCTTGSCGGGGQPNVCSSSLCMPESDGAFCARYGRNCGTFNATDNCGTNRTATCGSCTSFSETCGGGGTSNVCACDEPASAMCQRLGKNCGTLTAYDRCFRMRTVDCGSCFAPNTCGGGGTTNVCGNSACTGETMTELCELLGSPGGASLTADRCNVPRAIFCGDTSMLTEESTMYCQNGTEANPNSTPAGCEDRGGFPISTSLTSYGYSSFTFQLVSPAYPLGPFNAPLHFSFGGSALYLQLESRSTRDVAVYPLGSAGVFDGRRVAVAFEYRRSAPLGTDCGFLVTRCYGTAAATFSP